MSTAAGAGRLFPATGGLVARRSSAFVLINRAGQRAVVDGPICAEIEASLAQSAPTPGLQRLAPAHAALGELAAWLATPSVPLTRLDVVRLDGFDTLFLELLGRCNERCVHCYADSAPSVEAALDRATVMSVLDQAAQLGFRRVQLTGGDPAAVRVPARRRRARARGRDPTSRSTRTASRSTTIYSTSSHRTGPRSRSRCTPSIPTSTIG